MVLLLVSLYSHFLWFDFCFDLWVKQNSLRNVINWSQFGTLRAREASGRTVPIWFFLPWGLSLLLRGASLLRLSGRRFSLCCSRYRLRTGSSRDLRRPERGLKVGRNLPCEDMHYFDFLHFHFQQTEGRFLFLTHWKRQVHWLKLTLFHCVQFNY